MEKITPLLVALALFPTLLTAAGVDRKAGGTPFTGIVAAAKMAGNLGKVTVTLNAAPAGFQPGGLARLWIVK